MLLYFEILLQEGVVVYRNTRVADVKSRRVIVVLPPYAAWMVFMLEQ